MNALKIAPLILSADFSRLKEEVIVSGSGIFRRADYAQTIHPTGIAVG
jgi:pentose-5-phosphate-3-epimerase